MSMPSSLIVFHFTALSPMSTLQWYLRVEQRLSTEQRAAEQHVKAEQRATYCHLSNQTSSSMRLKYMPAEAVAWMPRAALVLRSAELPSRAASMLEHAGLNGAELGEFGCASRLCGQHPR